MKKILYFIILVFCTTIFFQSCTIEKRHFRPGYNIQWKGNSIPARVEASVELKHVEEIKLESPQISTSDKLIEEINVKEELVINSTEQIILTNNDCDLIKLIDGKIIEAKIRKATENEVTYIDCNNVYSPEVKLEKDKINSVRFADGEIINYTKTPTPVVQQKVIVKEEVKMEPQYSTQKYEDRSWNANRSKYIGLIISTILLLTGILSIFGLLINRIILWKSINEGNKHIAHLAIILLVISTIVFFGTILVLIGIG